MNLETHAILRNTIDYLIASQSETLRSLHSLKAIIATSQPDDLNAAAHVYPEAVSSLVPRINHSLLSVTHQGKNCFLGNTLPFRVLVRLLRRPNSYVSNETLLEEIWEGIRSPEAVRSVVKTLRAKLRDAGLEALSKGIDGTVKGHCAILLPD